MPLLESAGIARPVAAIRGLFPLLHILKFLLEKVWGYADINMLPRQCFIQGSLPVSVVARGKPAFVEGAQPVIVVKAFMPGIESVAQLPGFVDNLPKSAVTAGQDCFKLTGSSILPRKVGSSPAQALFEQFMLIG